MDPGRPPDATVIVTEQTTDAYLEYALSEAVVGRYFVMRFTASTGNVGAFGGTELRLGGGGAPLNIDFNSDNPTTPFSPTQNGFFGVDVIDGASSTINASFTGIDPNVAPTGSATLSLTSPSLIFSRDRTTTPANSGAFTYSYLYRDVIATIGGPVHHFSGRTRSKQIV